jgi:hypothetical protein
LFVIFELGINLINFLGSGVFKMDSMKQFHNLSLLFSGKFSNNLNKDNIKELSKSFNSLGCKYNSIKYELKMELIEDISISEREFNQESKRFKILGLLTFF